MNFFEFLDTIYRKTAAKLQENYSPSVDGYAKAAHGLVALERTIAKWISFPLILGYFIGVKLKIIKQPVFENPLHQTRFDRPELKKSEEPVEHAKA